MIIFFFYARYYSVGGFFFSSRRRHTRCGRDWSSDVCSSDLPRDRAGDEGEPGGGEDAGGAGPPAAHGGDGAQRGAERAAAADAGRTDAARGGGPGRALRAARGDRPGAGDAG